MCICINKKGIFCAAQRFHIIEQSEKLYAFLLSDTQMARVISHQVQQLNIFSFRL